MTKIQQFLITYKRRLTSKAKYHKWTVTEENIDFQTNTFSFLLSRPFYGGALKFQITTEIKNDAQQYLTATITDAVKQAGKIMSDLNQRGNMLRLRNELK